eukprot:TRINITY_DN1021_c0_g1_i3.p1 TRINITY_DN1021_c0_g1~~TRINITY_DN1021_c0_g1_i3.p1  ORF type:complete len:310 (-),score=84.26 TRINITY_DN1021_c0_g1_i3:134-1063(-)
MPSMKTLLILVLMVLHQTQHTFGKKPEKSNCVCDCADWSVKGQCECECKQPRTECAPGYTKVCPEKDGKCSGDTKAPLCPKDIFGFFQPSGRALETWVQVKEVEERNVEIGAPVINPRKKDRQNGVEVKCDGIPKFKCDFTIDYTVSTVKSFKASKCSHRKNFKKCPVTILTNTGCTVTAFLYNKQKTVDAKGKISIECDYTTTAAPTTTGAATTTAAEKYPPVEAVGDGCTCVPSFAMSMLSAGMTGVEARQAEVTEEPERENRKRGRVTQEVRCKGVPKFECDFITTTKPVVASTPWTLPSAPTGRM